MNDTNTPGAGDLPQMEILAQPLLDADGAPNPLAFAELQEAIDKMPADHERLAHDPEWSERKDQWTFRQQIVGAFAYNAIRQSPGNTIPIGLENVCGYLNAALATAYPWATVGMEELSLCDISRTLHEIMMEQGVAEFDAWNATQPDFIDLHALLRNVCLTIRTERRESKRFDDAFEARHAAAEDSAEK